MSTLSEITLIDAEGFYGTFGGAFVPEMLYANIAELQECYLSIMAEPSFEAELELLLRDFVGRPTPLFEAKRLSAKYGYQVLLKREDLCHTGAHKVNNTVGQILLAKRLGKRKIVAETGAGQHGVATATVCALMGMDCIVYMGEVDMARQQPNVDRMRMMGAKVVPATSGSKTLKDATNEAMRHWISHPADTHYIIGSAVGPHPYPDMVARFQAIISAECQSQLTAQFGMEHPAAVLACVGGGSNAAGAYYHYLSDERVKLFGAEAAGLGVETGHTAATLNLGTTGVLHGAMSKIIQTADGQVVEPYSISAGLDYPGIGPLHAYLHETDRVEYIPVTDQQALDAGFELSRLEGIIPALETAHALALLPTLDLPQGSTIIVCLSGRGDKDLLTYTKYLDQYTLSADHSTSSASKNV
jgi:tryptophan synthase beta chain